MIKELLRGTPRSIDCNIASVSWSGLLGWLRSVATTPARRRCPNPDPRTQPFGEGYRYRLCR